MIRATTPIHSFLFDVDPIVYDRVLITYSQGDNIVLEKTKEDLTIEPIEEGEGYRAWYRLTQEETNRFSNKPGQRIYVQIRVLTHAGEALASEKKLLHIQDVLNDEVLE